MTCLKMMLLGVYLSSAAAWMAAIGLDGASIVTFCLGTLLFLIGFFKKARS